jgi:hypothetical protein
MLISRHGRRFCEPLNFWYKRAFLVQGYSEEQKRAACCERDWKTRARELMRGREKAYRGDQSFMQKHNIASDIFFL